MPVRAAADTAVVQFAQEPDTLDPYLSALGATDAIASLFYSGLVLIDDHGEWVADLASRIPSIENGDVRLVGRGMRVTYHFRKGIKWQDGKPLTSKDLAATFALVMNPQFPGLSRAGYDQITRVETPDALTAVLVFKAAYAPFLELFPYVLPAHVIGTSGHPERDTWNREPMGTGPYRLVSWTSGDRLTATANADYFQGRPGVPRIELRFVGDDQSALNLYRSGELDLLQGASPNQLAVLKREVPERLLLSPSPTWEHLLLDLDSPRLKDVRVRQALAHLIDRDGINAAAYAGAFRPAWSDVPAASWAYNPKVENLYPYNPKRAAALLDSAGWRRGADGIRAKDGQRLHLQLVTTSDKPSRALVAQLWRKQWQDVGIELAIDRLPATAIFGAASTGGRLANGTFDLALIASSARPDPDTSYRYRSDQLPPAGQNRGRYRSLTVDRLLAEGQRTLPKTARKRIYARLAEQLGLDLPVIPLLYCVGIDAISRRLEGYRPNPTLRGNLWNVWEWKLKPS